MKPAVHRLLQQKHSTDYSNRNIPQTTPTETFHRLFQQKHSTDYSNRNIPQTTPTETFHRNIPQTTPTETFHRLLQQKHSTDYSNRNIPQTTLTETFRRLLLNRNIVNNKESQEGKRNSRLRKLRCCSCRKASHSSPRHR